jgi:hypothetical protein
MKQSSVRKDVKCAFGLLKVQHTSHPCPILLSAHSRLIMRACIILHNMIIDDERDDSYDDNYHTVASIVTPPVIYEALASLITILQRKTYLISGLNVHFYLIIL